MVKHFFLFFSVLVCAVSATQVVSTENACPPPPPCQQPLQQNSPQSAQPLVYKVRLDNCGRRPQAPPTVSAPTVTTAPVKYPPVVLPYKVPEPRTVSNTCRCEKTVVKPQTIKQTIVVPVIKRYIQTLAKPKYEVITYAAEPVNCPQFEKYENCGYSGNVPYNV